MRRSGSLLANREFVRLWASLTISEVGTRVTAVAWPLVAAVRLDATPAQMGLLVASTTLPALLVSLFAGVWADRRARRSFCSLCGRLGWRQVWWV